MRQEYQAGKGPISRECFYRTHVTLPDGRRYTVFDRNYDLMLQRMAVVLRNAGVKK